MTNGGQNNKMNHAQQVERLLKENNAILERQNKHKIYRFPDGKIYVESSTPSNDWLTDRNRLKQLKLVLGIRKTLTPAHLEFERIKKSYKPKHEREQPLFGSFRVADPAVEESAFTQVVLLGNQLVEVWELLAWTQERLADQEEYNKQPLWFIGWNRFKKRFKRFIRKLQRE